MAGAVVDQFRSGTFGLRLERRRRGDRSEVSGRPLGPGRQGRKRYCASDAAVAAQAAGAAQDARDLLPGGADGTLASATARFDPTLPSLLAVVNRSRTIFGDFDSIKRDEGSIQSRFTYMLWTRDRPYLVQVGSTNDADGRPSEVTFTVADDAALHTGGADSVSHRPVAQNH